MGDPVHRVRGARYHPGMRPTRPTVALLLACGLALSACGSDDEPAARTTSADAPAATTPATADAPPAAVATATAPVATAAPAPTTVATTATEPSGGTPPPVATVTAQQPPTAAGDQPTIALRGDGTARTTAVDTGQAEIWCDAARQGSYDARLGTATTLVIAVQGSDQVTRCELPR